MAASGSSMAASYRCSTLSIRTTNPVPPPVHIEEIIADRQTYLPGQSLALPALTSDIQIDYAGLSFVAPQKVRFRYKLDGHDTDWQEPGTRRQAFYSDLPPGKYRFHVIACNNDGLWNETGATLDFVVPPAVYQTVWFKVLLLLLRPRVSVAPVSSSHSPADLADPVAPGRTTGRTRTHRARTARHSSAGLSRLDAPLPGRQPADPEEREGATRSWKTL